MCKYFEYILIGLALVVLNGACKEEILPDEPIVGLGGDTWSKGEIDNWLEKEFLDPYNIEVKYKWDPYEVNYLRNMTPIKEENVKPVMTALKNLWIEPYVQAAGENFMKKLIPRQFVLGGSAEYNSDGTMVLGQAEGGRKILLLKLNDYDTKNKEEVQILLHTLYHEFAHILHQNILYPTEWKQLNPEAYTATWYNTKDDVANQQGLISAYAKANSDEDFVETIAFLLVNGQAYYDAVINREDVPEKAKKIFRTKRQLIIDYYKTNYQTDFLELQRIAQEAITNYLEGK